MRNRLAYLALMGIVVLLSACSSRATTSATAATATAANTAIPTNSPTPAYGMCRASDFLPPIRPQPNPPTGGAPGPFYGAPISDFQFPPLTYYYDYGPAAGTHHWTVCSPGDPASILAFMRQSIAASSWTIINTPSSDPNTFVAQKPVSAATPGVTTPVYCSTLNVIVGGFPGYPGEWSFAVFAPATPCQ
jgi:hypothetical protein